MVLRLAEETVTGISVVTFPEYDSVVPWHAKMQAQKHLYSCTDAADGCVTYEKK